MTDEAHEPASGPEMSMLVRAYRAFELLFSTHAKIARREASEGAQRILSGLLYLLVALIFAGFALILGHAAAVVAIERRFQWGYAASIGVVAGADVLLTLILLLIARARLSKPVLSETRAMVKKAASVLGVTTLALSVSLFAGCGGGTSDSSGGANGGQAGHGGEGHHGGTGGQAGNGNAGSGGDTDPGQPSALALYGAAIKTIVLEVDYATGAEPYTGSIVAMGDTWDLSEKNIARLFEGANKTIQVPHKLDEMEELTDVSGQEFTRDDVLAIADKHRNEPNTADKASIYVVWLPGYYKNKDGVQEQTLGVSFGTTGVIGMFKPVIESTGGAGTVVTRFVEQTTLVHELGHAAGLVNNGVPMAADHQDKPNGAHCVNSDCVMYYIHGGTADMVTFVQGVIAKGDTDLFGQECLDDAQAAVAAGASK